MAYTWILLGHGNDFVIRFSPIDHLHDPDYFRGNQAKLNGGYLGEHNDIQWIMVFTQGLRDKPIVEGVIHGSINNPIEFDQTAVLVNFILRTRTFRDFDNGVDVTGWIFAA